MIVFSNFSEPILTSTNALRYSGGYSSLIEFHKCIISSFKCS